MAEEEKERTVHLEGTFQHSTWQRFRSNQAERSCLATVLLSLLVAGPATPSGRE